MHIALQLAFSRSASIGCVKLAGLPQGRFHKEDLHAGCFGQCGQRFGFPISSRLRTCPLQLIHFLAFALTYGHPCAECWQNVCDSHHCAGAYVSGSQLKQGVECSQVQRTSRAPKTFNSYSYNLHNRQPLFSRLVACNISSRSHTITRIVQCFKLEFCIISAVCTIIKAQQEHFHIDNCFIYAVCRLSKANWTSKSALRWDSRDTAIAKEAINPTCSSAPKRSSTCTDSDAYSCDNSWSRAYCRYSAS